eukprot:2196713-Alexandrium_andersonii.AAC.1
MARTPCRRAEPLSAGAARSLHWHAARLERVYPTRWHLPRGAVESDLSTSADNASASADGGRDAL